MLLVGCGDIQYSPWQSSPPNFDLTAKHLAKLEAQDTGIYEKFTIAIVGDPQAEIDGLDRALAIINSRSDLDFVAIVGDLTDRGLELEYRLVDKAIAKFNKPVLTIVGNHDGLSNGSKIYQEMFGPLNYSFIYKDTKFVMWNNNAYEWKIDLDWLASEVSSHHRVVIMAHQPPNDGALSFEQESRWFEIRQKANVIASIHGHKHHYSFKREEDLPIYVVDRVQDGGYGTLTFNERLEFYNCSPICHPAEEMDD